MEQSVTTLWDACWLNAQVATFDAARSEAYGIIHDAAIAIANGKIAWIGSQVDLPDAPEKLAKQIYSAQGQWITPGLIDCHTHLIYAGNRAQEFEQRLQGLSYVEIAKTGGGIHATVKATRLASETELLEQSIPRLKALLAEGVTTVEIKSGYGLDIQNEIKILRVAKKLAELFPVKICATFLGAHTIPLEYKAQPDEYVRIICEEMLPQIATAKLADAVDIFCESIGFNLQQTEKILLAAQKYNFAVKLHAEQLSDFGGARLAAKYRALSADHLEYLSEGGIKMMAANDTVAVLLPGAFYFLQEKQLPPIDLFRKYQVPIAIATDCNPGTSPITSLLLILNMACTLFRLTPEEALLGVTRNAAKALGIDKTHGSLAVGKTADFVIWNIKHPVDLVYQMGFNACSAIIKDGHTVFSNKENR
jgi:imidazolonepropionase